MHTTLIAATAAAAARILLPQTSQVPFMRLLLMGDAFEDESEQTVPPQTTLRTDERLGVGWMAVGDGSRVSV